MFEIIKAIFGEKIAQFLQQLWHLIRQSFFGHAGAEGDNVLAHGKSHAQQDVRDPGQFRTHLPYRSYDNTYGLFTLTDGIGFVLEAMPQSGADQSMADMLRGLYTAPWTAGASLQITLFATPHIKPILIDFANLRATDEDSQEKSVEFGREARNENLFRRLARRRVEHYLRGAKESLTPGGNYMLRDFRLVVSAYLPCRHGDNAAKEQLSRLRDNVAATLKNAAFPTRTWEPVDLINWCGDFCNPHRLFEEVAPTTYDPFRQLRDQMVDIDTRQNCDAPGIQFTKPNREEGVEARFYAVKSYPERFSLWRMGALIGDSLQGSLQYPCPFLLTMGVQFMNPADVKMSTTANQARATQNAESKMSSYMPDVGDKKRDWDEALREVNASGNLVRMYHSLGLFARPSDIHRAETTAEGLWRDQGFVINNITFLHRPALMSTLPMSFSLGMQHDLYSLGISSTKSISNAVHMSPMVSEWRGSKNPVVLFGGRRGQTGGFDLFDNTEGNPSAAIIGTPGSGKSVFLNEFAWSYLGCGAKVWMMDLGKSFERLCKKANGQMIDLKAGCGININPFSSVIEKDFADDLAMLVAIVAKMAAPFGALDPFQYAALTTAITRAWNQHKNSMTVTHLRDIFRPGRLNDGDPHDLRLTDLAVMLEPYSEGGTYAEFFDGPSNVDFSRNLVVIEAESLKRSPSLHRVVLMSLLFRITSEMYFTRNRRKLLMIDELKQQLGDDDDPVLARIIEEAARRARKYGGSLVTATHQVEDYHASPALLTAFTLSDAVFLLRQRKESVELLARSGKLSLDEHKKRVLQSLRLEKGAFAEIYAFTQMGEGVMRSILDPHTLLMFSNRIEDNAPIDELTAKGMELDDAMDTILRDRGILPMGT
jgi:conjugal transfer ATP-binding protein TraC